MFPDITRMYIDWNNEAILLVLSEKGGFWSELNFLVIIHFVSIR